MLHPEECTWQNYRLPTGILPQAYRLTLEAILVEGYNATGYLEIDMYSAEPTQCIVLHAMGMTIDSATAVFADGSQYEGGCTHVAAFTYRAVPASSMTFSSLKTELRIPVDD